MKQVYLCHDTMIGIYSAFYDAWKESRNKNVGIALWGRTDKELFCEYHEVEESRKKEQAISNKVAGAFGIGSQEGNRQGDTGSGTGNQGSPFGNSDHGANEGVGGYGSFNLNGRSIGAGGLPRPAYTIQEAVSYTHLDVYKRQKYYIPKIAKQKKAILTDSQSSLLTLNLIP